MTDIERAKWRAEVAVLRDSIDWSKFIAPGMEREDFDHQTCLDGLQKLWRLSEDDTQAILNGAPFNSEDWMRRIELLFQLLATLAGLKRESTAEERQEYQCLWLRTERKHLKGQTPLLILRQGETSSIEGLLAFVAGA